MEHETGKQETKSAAATVTEAPYADWNGSTPIYRKVCGDFNKDGAAVEALVGTGAPAKDAGTVVLLHVLGDVVREARPLIHTTDRATCGLVLSVDGTAAAVALAEALEFAAQTIRGQLRANHVGQG